MVMVHIIMTALKGLADKYRRKVSKNVCLDKGHQYFYKINKYCKPYRYW